MRFLEVVIVACFRLEQCGNGCGICVCLSYRVGICGVCPLVLFGVWQVGPCSAFVVLLSHLHRIVCICGVLDFSV